RASAHLSGRTLLLESDLAARLGPGLRKALSCLVVGRGVDDQAALGVGGHPELAGGERQRAGLRVDERAGARLEFSDLMPGPQLGELAADAGEAADVFFPVGI